MAACSSSGADKLADGGAIVLTGGALAKRPGKGGAALGCVNAALDFTAKALANDFGPRLRASHMNYLCGKCSSIGAW